MKRLFLFIKILECSKFRTKFFNNEYENKKLGDECKKCSNIMLFFCKQFFWIGVLFRC